MIKKIIILILIISNISAIYSVDCSFETNNCQRTMSAFNTFNLDFQNSSNPNLLESFSAKIYNKNNPSNEILLKTNQNLKTIKNLNPFTEPGVYILEIKAKSLGGSIMKSNFSFIFDNLEPMPPIIKLNIIGNKIKGKTQFSNTKFFVRDLNSKQLYSGISNNNGSFIINNLGLKNKINVLKFYTINSQGIESKPLERIIFLTKIIENKNSLINSLSLDNLNKINERTVLDITSKRNFLIMGKTTNKISGGIIYINGIKTLTDSNGNFAQFILLNEGLNNIEVLNSNGKVLASKKITYVKPRFKFTKFNYKKVVNGNIGSFKGETNLDLPFNVYLNGKYFKTIIPKNKKFSFKESNLIPGKNYIFLEGLNQEKLSKLVYSDTKKPIINLMIPNRISHSNDFIFSIKDDISINISSVKVNFNNGKFLYFGGKILKNGDFYKVDISKIPQGNYNFIITAKDLVGNKVSLSSNLNINNINTLIEDIYVPDNGYFIGNQLFLNSQDLTIVLTPSRDIAFKSIYLDDKRITDYTINPNGEISIHLNSLNTSGILNFNFVNNKLQEFSQKYFYFTDLEKPIVKLDYIQNSQNIIGKNIKISGKIIDSHFNWDSLSFNSKNNIIRYGNYFEANVPILEGKQNLLINGFDLSGNSILNSNKNLPGITYGDNYKVEFSNSNNIFNSEINIVISNPDTFTKKFINSYDGFYFNKIFINQRKIELPINQREGLRSINLNGEESSNQKFSSSQLIIIDSIKPTANLVNNSNGETELILDGTLSPINSNSIKLIIDGNDINQLNQCSNSISTNSYCLIIPQFTSTLQIKVNDTANNFLDKTFENSIIPSLSSIKKISNLAPKIYFSGNDNKTKEKNTYIQGQIRSYNEIKSVKVRGGNNCEFDSFNFVCLVNITKPGINSYDILVNDKNSQTNNKEINITRDTGNFSIHISNLIGNNIYKFFNKYYITKSFLNLSGNVSKNSTISLIMNKEEVLVGNKINGSFQVPVDFSNLINDKENLYINLSLKAEDKLGNIVESKNYFTIIYNRILKTLVKVFIN